MEKQKNRSFPPRVYSAHLSKIIPATVEICLILCSNFTDISTIYALHVMVSHDILTTLLLSPKCNYLLEKQNSRLRIFSENSLMDNTYCHTALFPPLTDRLSTVRPLLKQLLTDSLLLQPTQLKMLSLLCVLRSAYFLYDFL
jgi:hypothetical protein